jgi:hypothetical protein
MHPRAELVVGTALVLLLAVGAGVIAPRRGRVTDADQRRSTFLVGPFGARGYRDALERLGVRVEAYQRPTATLDTTAPPGTVVAVLGPSSPLAPHEGVAIASLQADLLLAGPGAAAAFRCLGYEVQSGWRDSLVIAPPRGSEARPFPRARAILVPRRSTAAVDSVGSDEGTTVTCSVPAVRRVDTLLRTTRLRPVVVRAELEDGRTVTLVADDWLFGNRALRETAAGPFALGLVVPRYRRVIVDEYHHGFDASRSLSGATWEWTRRTPWGWAVLQLAGVGLIALLAAGVRFGPVRSGIVRRRRSPLEHVRALATALAAARGHDVAIGLIVQGLRRRLSPAGRGSRAGTARWFDELDGAVRTPRGRQALDTLRTVTTRPATGEDVLQAADAVETLWEELTPT